MARRAGPALRPTSAMTLRQIDHEKPSAIAALLLPHDRISV
jgi:hypothetical protein